MEAPLQNGTSGLQMRRLQIQLLYLTVSIDGERAHRTPEVHESHLPARAMHPPRGISLDSLQ